MGRQSIKQSERPGNFYTFDLNMHFRLAPQPAGQAALELSLNTNTPYKLERAVGMGINIVPKQNPLLQAKINPSSIFVFFPCWSWRFKAFLWITKDTAGSSEHHNLDTRPLDGVGSKSPCDAGVRNVSLVHAWWQNWGQRIRKGRRVTSHIQTTMGSCCVNAWAIASSSFPSLSQREHSESVLWCAASFCDC